MSDIVLYGYHYSVYARIAKMVCLEKGIPFTWSEIDPFADPPDPRMEALNPFGRVPILEQGPFRLHETQAITRYLDEAFDGPSLQPDKPKDRARMAQVIGIVDSYAYWPLVRQVFAQAVFAPAAGEEWDPAEVEAGLSAAHKILDALNRLSGDEGILNGTVITLADLHLAPMIAYFTQAPRATAMVEQRPGLSAWWQAIQARNSLIDSDPGLPATRR